jgi:hypothetical protein
MSVLIPLSIQCIFKRKQISTKINDTRRRRVKKVKISQAKKDNAKTSRLLRFIKHMRIVLLYRVSARETCACEARYDWAMYDQILPGMYLPRWDKYWMQKALRYGRETPKLPRMLHHMEGINR